MRITTIDKDRDQRLHRYHARFWEIVPMNYNEIFHKWITLKSIKSIQSSLFASLPFSCMISFNCCYGVSPVSFPVIGQKSIGWVFRIICLSIMCQYKQFRFDIFLFIIFYSVFEWVIYTLMKERSKADFSHHSGFGRALFCIVAFFSTFRTVAFSEGLLSFELELDFFI